MSDIKTEVFLVKSKTTMGMELFYEHGEIFRE